MGCMEKKGMQMGLETVVGLTLVLIIGVIYLAIVKGGLLTGKKNIDALSECKAQSGRCVATKEACDGLAYHKLGCPGEAPDEKGEWCCVKSAMA